MTAATDTHPQAASSGADHGHGHDGHGEHIHPPSYYVKIWAILLGLMALSLIGSEVPVKIVVLMAAFGIAVVKAYLVCAKFMHLDIEKKFVIYFLVVALAFMALFYFGTAPDVMKHEGHHWNNVAAKAAIERGLKADAAGAHGGHGEGAPAAH